MRTAFNNHDAGKETEQMKKVEHKQKKKKTVYSSFWKKKNSLKDNVFIKFKMFSFYFHLTKEFRLSYFRELKYCTCRSTEKKKTSGKNEKRKLFQRS